MLKKIIHNIPLIRPATALISGIMAGSLFNFNLNFLILALLVVVVLLLIASLFYSFRITLFFGAGIYILFAVAGIWRFQAYNRRPELFTEGKYSATVLEILQEKPKSYQSVLKISAFFRNDSVFKTNEKVMVYFAKSEKASRLKPGEQIVFDKTPQPVENSIDLNGFDYAGYLERKRIYRQVYLPDSRWIESGMFTHNFLILAERTRLQMLEIFRNQDLGEKELNVLSALTLGYKRGLDPETKRVFSAAGAMHVLAVSGLHVGIVFMILSFFLSFLKKRKRGEIAYLLVMITSLWCFAFLTGLSPSVSRAAAMFTIVVIASVFKKSSNIYQSLVASAFVLLLLNPNNLFEVGFQLSYAAVFGIVFLQPRLNKIFTFRFRVSRYFWALLTTSVAAQIATFPLSAFYFNQFPTFFWVSNLVVIPAAGILIPLGISLLFFGGIPLIAVPLTKITGFVLQLVIQFLETVEKFPLSVLEFSVHRIELIFLYLTMFFSFIFIASKKKVFLKRAIFLLFILLSTSFAIKLTQFAKKQEITNSFRNYPGLYPVQEKGNDNLSQENFQ
jgi:competence protein ComEC